MVDGSPNEPHTKSEQANFAECDLHDPSQRDPPGWLPTAAIGTLPATVGAAAVFGSIDSRWAIAALFLGFTVFFFLVALWSVPVSLRGVSQAFAFALVGSSLLVGGLLALTRLADEMSPSGPAPIPPGATSPPPP